MSTPTVIQNLSHPEPYRVDLIVQQGANFDQTIAIPVTTLSLSGYTTRGKVKPSHGSSTLTLNLATATTPIAVNTTQNGVRIVLTAAETAALTAGRYVWDCEIISAGSVVSRFAEGSFVVTPEVTT